MSSTKHDILVTVTQTGITQVDNAMRQFSNTSGVATKSQDALGGALGKTQGAAVKLRSDVDKGERSTSKANTTTGKFAQSQDKAAGSTKSFAEKFQGNRGLIFSVTGIITAGVEAIGMFQNFQNALAKQSAAQDTLNRLEQEGITTGREYTQAQRDLDDANRSVSFALRIMALSMGDLIPFSLLLVNQFVNMRAAAQQAAAAKQTLTATTQALGTASQQAAAGGLAQMFTSTGQVTNGVNALTPAVRNTTVATNELFTSSGRLVTGFTPMGRAITDNTNFIGTRNSGLVGGINALNTGMIATERQGGRFSGIFTTIGNAIRALPGHFTSAGSAIKGFFTNFSANISGASGITDKFKAAFASMAGGIAVGGKGISGAFKAMGTAVVGFGRALIGVFVSNPILGILTAIGVAVAALIFDFGGFRTAINKTGEAIGNAIPFLKGALTWIGQVGNAALDAVAGFFGFETATMKASDAVAELKFQTDPLIMSMKQILELNEDVASGVDRLTSQYGIIRDAISIVTETTTAWAGTTKLGYNQVIDAFEPLHTSVLQKYPQMAAAGEQFRAKIDEIKNSTLTQKEKQDAMNVALDEYDMAAGEALKQDVQREQQIQALTAKIDAAIMSTNEDAASQRRMVAAYKESQEAGSKAAAQLTEHEKVALDFAKTQGFTIEQYEKMAQHLKQNAVILEGWGDAVVLTNENTIDLAASNQKLVDIQLDLSKQAFATWGLMKKSIDEVGVNALPIVEANIRGLLKVNPEVGKQVQELYEHWKDELHQTSEGLSDLIDKAQEQADVAVTAENEIIEAETKRRESLLKKALQLDILNDVQGLSTDLLEVATEAESESQKAQNASIATLQRLALQRGLEADLLTQGTDKHLEYIKTHDLAAPTIEEVRARTVQLIAARQEDQKATALEQAATEEYVKSLGFHIDATGLSAKGLMAVTNAYDETTKATQIATDDVAEWAAQLTRNQAVEEETIKQLLEYARVHGIEIPAEVERSSGAIRDFIENGLEEVGPAAEEAAKEAQAAFDEIAGKAHSALDGIISDELGEDSDNIKDAIKGIKKAGFELDQLTAVKRVIQIFLDDESFENDIIGLGDIMRQEFGRLEDFSREEGMIIGETFVTHIQDEIGKKMPEAANAVEQIWQQTLATSSPEETGDQLIGRFTQALVNNEELKNAGIGMSSGVADGLASGETFVFDEAGNLVSVAVGALEEGANQAPGAMESLVTKYLGAAKAKEPAVQSAGLELGESVLGGADQAAEQAAGPMENLVNKYLAPAKASPEPQQTGLKMGQDTATGVQTGVEPIPGIFNQSFLDASTLGGATLVIILQAVQTTMSNMSTSVATYSDSMKINFTTAIQNMTLALPPLDAALQNTQQVMSTLSTSVATYANSMMTNISNFTTQAISDLGLWDAAMKTSQENSTTLSTTVSTDVGNMKTNIVAFRTSAVSDFELVASATVELREEASSLSTSIDTYMSSMTSKINSFASNAIKSFSNVGLQAQAAASDVKKLQQAIDSLKDKTVTITVKYNVQGKPSGLQHGGTFIADEPTRIAGVNVAETFPEIVNVIPLDPKEPNSPLNDITLNTPNIAPNIPSLEGIPTSAMGGGGSNVTVQGNLYATIQLPSGETLAKTVKPFMLKGYSSIMS